MIEYMASLVSSYQKSWLNSNKVAPNWAPNTRGVGKKLATFDKLECGPMPNVMAALPIIDGALCSVPQSLADAHYQSAVQ